MISVKPINNETTKCHCANCGRVLPLIIKLQIANIETILCEDCSAAIGRLHIKAIKNNQHYAYVKDEDRIIKE